MKLSFTSYLGVFLLLVGVAAGVFLVQSEQDIRNKAKELKDHKVTICHKTGSESNPWVQIEISQNAWKAHAAHGDIQGNCPSPEKEDDGEGGDGGGNDDSGGGSDGDGGLGGVTLPSNITVNNNTTYVQPEPSPVIKYVYITTRFDFWTKHFGIDEKRPDKKVRVIFRIENEELHVYNSIFASADYNGVYHATITDVRPGTFEVLLKGEGYLQKRFEDVAIRRGSNKYYWQDEELIPGDFNSDNIIEPKDIAELLSIFSNDANPEVEDKSIFDVNMDNMIDAEDVKLVLVNYNRMVMKGDE
jgi:hypothetical protein